MPTVKRTAIYCRCSTTDQPHSIENQRIDLMRYVEQRGWAVYQVYTDEGVSGGKDRRPGLDALMLDAKRRRFDVVLVTKFDRFARSAKHLLNALDEYGSLGIDFISLCDSVDTTTPYGKALFTIIAAMAELERELIRSRIKNGLEKARERGKHIGRPKAGIDLFKAQRLYIEGRSYESIGRTLKVAGVTVKRALRQNPIQKLEPALVEA